MLSRRGRRPVCPAEQSSALRVIAHQWCRLVRKTDRNYDRQLGAGCLEASCCRASARPPRRGRLGLRVRREIALNGSSQAGTFQSTVIGRVFQLTVSAFEWWRTVPARFSRRASFARLGRRGRLPLRACGYCDYFPAHARPSADGPASINFSTVQSDVRITATFLLASQET
jgi:hypothetical protein